MENVVLIKRDTSLDRLVSALSGTFATLAAPFVGACGLVAAGAGQYEYLPCVAMAPAIYLAGQYFYNPKK